MWKNSKIYISGHTGLLGSAIVRRLKKDGFTRIILRTKSQLDLTDEKKVSVFFHKERPDYVFHAAARVGSMMANIKHPAEFIYENIKIQTNVIHQSHLVGVKKLVFFGSNCVYPRISSQPIKEEYLLTASLEPTNEAYAVAKIAGMKLCESYNRQYGTNFISVVPASIYGPNDHFGSERSHTTPQLIREIHEAKIKGRNSVAIDIDSRKIREFIYVDDVADACIFLIRNMSSARIRKIPFLNIGTGQSINVKNLTELVKKIIGFKGKIVWTHQEPKGMSSKVLDSRKIHNLGWHHRINLQEGIKKTYDWFLKYYSI